MLKKSGKRSLIFKFFIINATVLFISSIALLTIAINIQRSFLEKEAEIIADKIIDFKNWVNQSRSHRNHTVATKELGNIASINSNHSFKVASLNSRDVDDFESHAIKAFAENEDLKHFERREGSIYKYAKPLKTDKSCLGCHTSYKEAQLAGIISVEIKNAGVLPEFELKGGLLTYLPIIVALFLIIYSFAWFEIRIIRPLGEISSALQEVERGDYNVRIPFKGKDEIGEIANAFNTTMDRLITLIQTEEERKQLHQNLLKFLETLSSASEGDLTRRLEVTSDIVGSLADAFNFMVDGLSELIEKVKVSAEEISAETTKILSVSKQLETGASSQMAQLELADQAVTASALSANKITEKTKTAEEISINAKNAVINGNKALKSSLEGIQLIRNTIQSINKRMKNLSERLLEIVTISHLISEIANRTNILAINASIEAMRAGEQGKGFIVISDEIRDLADKAHKSSKQISDIISAIQMEASLVTRHLEEETKYVEMGSKTVFDTETAFKDIEKTIQDMEVIISTINSFAESQKKLTSDVVVFMEGVQKVSEQVLNLIQDFTEISRSLAKTSESLISSIERFKLSSATKKKSELI